MEGTPKERAIEAAQKIKSEALKRGSYLNMWLCAAAGASVERDFLGPFLGWHKGGHVTALEIPFALLALYWSYRGRPKKKEVKRDEEEERELDEEQEEESEGDMRWNERAQRWEWVDEEAL